MRIDLSVVVPAYNEGSYLKFALIELIKTLNSMHISYEVILIDDKSLDKTPEAITDFAKLHDGVKVILHKSNIGRGGTIKEGFLKAEGEIVGFIDIDFEVHCRYIPAIVQAINNGFDGAVAWRHYRWDFVTLHRHILSKGYHHLVKIMLGLPFNDTESGFKFFKRKKVMNILEKSKDNHWFFDTEIMALSYYYGLNICEIPAIFRRNPDSKSTVRLFPDCVKYIKALFRFKKSMKRRDFIQK